MTETLLTEDGAKLPLKSAASFLRVEPDMRHWTHADLALYIHLVRATVLRRLVAALDALEAHAQSLTVDDVFFGDGDHVARGRQLEARIAKLRIAARQCDALPVPVSA